MTFQSAVPHPLVRASKLLNARRRSFNQYQPQFGQRIILDLWPQQHGQSRTLRVCLGQFQWGGPRQTAPGVRQSSKPPGALLLKRQSLQNFATTPYVPAKIGACTRSPRNIEISAKIPLQDFLVSANIPTGLDCGWLCWTGPLALMGIMCSGPRVEATPLTNRAKCLHSLHPYGTATHVELF